MPASIVSGSLAYRDSRIPCFVHCRRAARPVRRPGRRDCGSQTVPGPALRRHLPDTGPSGQGSGGERRLDPNARGVDGRGTWQEDAPETLAALEELRTIPVSRFTHAGNAFSFFLPLVQDDHTNDSSDAREALRRLTAWRSRGSPAKRATTSKPHGRWSRSRRCSTSSIHSTPTLPGSDAAAASRTASTTSRGSTAATWSS